MKHKYAHLIGISSYIFLLGLFIVSCDVLTRSSQTSSLEQTRVAIEQVLTQQALESQRNQALQATQVVLQATQLAQQATLTAVQAEAIPPTEATSPTLDVTPTTNINLQVRAAKILLYENMSGEKIYGIYHPRYAQAALDRGGFSYTNVGSALGWFKDSLLNQPEWDLIIASSEAHAGLSGEYFTYIIDHVKRGSALIMEVWNLDDQQGGTIAPLLADCGVEVYADWADLASLIMWPLVPDHPIFSYPNQSIKLTSATPFWVDDFGDLMKVTGEGDAQMLAGTQQSQLNDHGTITTCLDGRMILQTFRSHDFARYDMENLWENYIYFVLKSKFGGS